MSKKDIIEYKMNEAKEKADENLIKYFDTNEEEYLNKYHKYQDDYRQYCWELSCY